MGSIPPAESIEYPQKEIVGVIQYAYDNKFYDYNNVICGAPDNADLLQLLKAIYGLIHAKDLTAPKILYVNGTTGNDATQDGQASTVGGGHGPYKTIQKALSKMTEYNLAGFSFTINVADNTYTGPVDLPLPNGSGSVYITGNVANPQNCLITSAAGSAVRANNGGTYVLNGFTYQSTAGIAGDAGHGIGIFNANVDVVSARFLNCVFAHIFASNSTLISITGPIIAAGNAAYHVFGGNNSVVTADTVAPVVTISTPVTFSQAYIGASNLGVVTVTYTTITGAGNVTGKRYDVQFNAILSSGGGGANYYPGTIAGTTATGGQYA